MIIDAPTDRQLQILRFIARELFEKGAPPTVREIADEIGITSTNGVADHLKALVRKGLLESRYATARGVKLTRRGWGLVDGDEGRCPTCHQRIRRAA